MNIDAIKQLLKDLENVFRDEKKIVFLESTILNNKKLAIEKNNQDLSKEYWILQQVFEANKYFISAFRFMKDGKYYEGWCDLEKAELRIHFLSRHYDPTNNEYKIKFINEQIPKYQSIFPYKVFFSTELLEKKIQCSICEAVITPRKRCEHIQGDIYNGEMCSRRITDAEFLGIAVVQNPVHKYSVAFVSNENGEKRDQYDYSLLKYLLNRLESPYEFWDIDTSPRRHPHSNFNYVGRNDKCPCGSGKKYKKCCLDKEGVLIPHIEFILENFDPKDVGKVEYTYIKK